MLEVEVKLRIEDLEAVRNRLRSLGARPGPVEDQEDLYFRHPSRDFARTDEALRLRRIGGRLELTYKGPRQGGGAKVRNEQTLALGSDPTGLLESLGFTPAHRVRKRREPWSWSGVEVALDEVEGLGRFVEVESVGPDAARATALVEGALRGLGLDRSLRETRSYLELVLSAGGAGLRK